MSIQLVQDELDRAREAVEQLRQLGGTPHVHDMAAVRKHFTTVLIHGNRVFTKLEQLAKTPAMQPWFGRKKSDRKADPLLSYMQHARNADEHTILAVIEIDEGAVAITVERWAAKPGADLVGLEVDDKGQLIYHPAPGVKIASNRPRAVRLRPAVDRGQTYPVPEKHQGEYILPPVPLTYADLFVTYLDALVAEARVLI